MRNIESKQWTTEYKGFTIQTGIEETQPEYKTYWAEVWEKDEPLYRWIGLSCYQKAKEWVDSQQRSV